MTAGIAPSNLTVVVPTRNEEQNITRFLQSVPPSVSLVVVDSSTDRTPDMVEQIRPGAEVIRARANIPVARQIGAGAADTEWLLFTDADVVFRPDYFSRLAATSVPGEVGGVVGAKATTSGYHFYHRWFTRGQAALNAFGIPAASGSNMLVRHDVLRSVGGFDPRLSVNEDTELMFRVARSGWDVDFRPDLSVLAFDHRRLELGLARKIAHGAIRNTALWFGWFDQAVRSSDWGYWSGEGDAVSAVEAHQ